jgi:molybdopterin converting factor small subunit
MMVVNVEYITTLYEITKKYSEKINLAQPATVRDLINNLVEKYGTRMKTSIFPNGNQEVGIYIAILAPERGYVAVDKIDASLKDGDTILMGQMLFGG